MIVYTDKHRIPFQIDESDYEAVSRYSWHIGDGGYPHTMRGQGAPGPNGRWPIRLHEFLLGPAGSGLVWDHRNRSPLDNRRENLRRVTQMINARNSRLRSNNRSGVKGVSWNVERRRWVAYITPRPGKMLNLGRFYTFEEASTARAVAETRYWGTE